MLIVNEVRQLQHETEKDVIVSNVVSNSFFF